MGIYRPDENDTTNDSVLNGWRNLRRLYAPGQSKLGGSVQSREQFELDCIDYARDDRGTSIPLADEYAGISMD
jgi:hypothetical protein